MSGIRAGLFTGLLFFTGITPFVHNSHQGEYHQLPLYGSVGDATLSVGQSPSKLAIVTGGKVTSGNAAVLSARTSHQNNPRPWYYSIQHAGPVIFHKFTCIIFHESRSTWSHPNLGDNSKVGSSGIFQFEDSTWLARSGFHFHVWLASPRQQAIGALRLEQADGFGPWTTSALC